jgi:hypothetical protein
MLETIISLFSAIGAFGNVAFLTVAAGAARVLNADRKSQKDLATKRVVVARNRLRRRTNVRAARVRKRVGLVGVLMALIALSTTQRQHLRRLGGRTQSLRRLGGRTQSLRRLGGRTQSLRRLTTFGGRLLTGRGPASDVDLRAEPDEEEALD